MCRCSSASAWSTCTIPFNAEGQRRCSCTWLSTGLDSQPLISAGAFKPSSVYELRVTTNSQFLAQPFRAEFAIAATQSIGTNCSCACCVMCTCVYVCLIDVVLQIIPFMSRLTVAFFQHHIDFEQSCENGFVNLLKAGFSFSW